MEVPDSPDANLKMLNMTMEYYGSRFFDKEFGWVLGRILLATLLIYSLSLSPSLLYLAATKLDSQILQRSRTCSADAKTVENKRIAKKTSPVDVWTLH